MKKLIDVPIGKQYICSDCRIVEPLEVMISSRICFCEQCCFAPGFEECSNMACQYKTREDKKQVVFQFKGYYQMENEIP